FRPEQSFSGPNEDKRREAAVGESKEFVYPEEDEPPNGGGNAFLADNDGDDSPDRSQILVKKVYSLGNRLPKADDQGEEVLDDQKTEPLKRYSFAFAIRASKYDTNLSINPGQFRPGNDLYHVRVMVFRDFFYNAAKVQQEGKGVDPIYEMDFEVAR
ncbi:MAG: hypothetical protein ACRD2T_13955, partial [Thermoanaerobaculia bacterium]